MKEIRKPRRSSAAPAKDQTCLRIEQMEAEREQRRLNIAKKKKARAEENERNIAAGNPGDVDFIGMVRNWRKEHEHYAQPHQYQNQQQDRICIAVRKRPITDKERAKNDHDSVTCLNPEVWVHSAKLKVDGITKYLDHSSFTFDHAFDENISNEDVYLLTAKPLLDHCMEGNGGRSTIFAFGQTGSGKTYTMQGIQELLVEDLFMSLDKEGGCSFRNTSVCVSFFELYGGSIQDLLNNRASLRAMEDGNEEVQINGLTEHETNSPEELLEILETGNLERTTHATEANDASSRSHAICQICLRDRNNDALRGKISLVDLAGSERGIDTKSHNAQRREESSHINTSLLALKECIRALDNKKKPAHVPYRSSQLTRLLKDCFTSEKAKTTMIATISPGATSADHSVNTLRYADRVKEKGTKKGSFRKISPTRGTVTGKSQMVKSKSVSPKSQSKTKVSSQQAASTTSSSPVRQPRAQVVAAYETEQTSQEVKYGALLNEHMNFITENADLLSQEGQILRTVENGSRSADDIENYISALEDILDKREKIFTSFSNLKEKSLCNS